MMEQEQKDSVSESMIAFIHVSVSMLWQKTFRTLEQRAALLL